MLEVSEYLKRGIEPAKTLDKGGNLTFIGIRN